MSEPVLSWKRQDAQDAVETLETFDKHGLPAFVRGVDAEALYFFLALFRTGTLPRAAEQLGSVSRAPTACSRSSAPIGTIRFL